MARKTTAAASPASAPVVVAEVAQVVKPDSANAEKGEAQLPDTAAGAELSFTDGTERADLDQADPTGIAAGEGPAEAPAPVKLTIRNHSAAVLTDRVHGLLLPPGGCVHADAADEAHADEIRQALAALAAENYIAADLLTIESA